MRLVHAALVALPAVLQAPASLMGLAGRSSSAGPATGASSGDLDLLRSAAHVGAAALVTAAVALPPPAHASYALYQASQNSYTERKATGYVPVATNDKATLASIQEDILKKRPASALKVKKTPQYCAGQMASVQPMMENICSNIGLSKADQSNTMVDDFGNMNIGVYNEAYKKAQAQAMDYERLRAANRR